VTFKKDYINYLLYTVVNTGSSEFKDNYRLRKLVDSIMSVDDVMKVTYLAGKTAGLEILFKYLLYISDKIDKSHVTIFNLKDNFEYDVMNLTKICEKITQYKGENVQEAIKNITKETEATSDKRSMVKIDVDEDTKESNLINIENIEDVTDESEEDSGDSKLTLIENVNIHTSEAEVFELDSINESIENSDVEQKEEVIDKDESIVEENAEEDFEEIPEETTEIKTEIEKEPSESQTSDEEPEDETEEIEQGTEDEITSEQEQVIEKSKEEATEEITEEVIAEKLPEVEIVVHKPINPAKEEEHIKEEAITSEAYYKFESRFFEEVKILEKLFAAVDKDCKTGEAGKLGEKCLQGLTEIIEITSELSNLSRQLSFDLIADIFLTMNLYFTKAISHPKILTGERIKLFDSSLALVNSLIKGEDYLNYDTMVDKIEKLKSDMSGTQEEEFHEEELKITEPEEKETGLTESKEELIDEKYTEPEVREEIQLVSEKTTVNQSQMDSANFKLKYLIKEFEKSFTSIDSLKGEYIKFDALEKISELNNILRLIAKISASVKLYDVLKLAEVTYVFLKYVKDYRMNLLEPEIKQIIKYIIFTFKMLLTNRKPEDFNVLVQHLNNPVKIFTDS